MIAYIDVANVPSQRLHETFGLEPAGLLKAVGFKYGRWTDSILMQRSLGPGNATPPDHDNATRIPKIDRKGK
jgi:L-amino acid N-acyltransferase YncA